MDKNRVKKRIELSNPVKILIGIIVSCLIGVVVTILLSILFSYILSQSPEISKFISIYFIISVLSGAFVCGFAGSKFLSFKGLFSGLISSIPFSLIILLIMLLVSDGAISISSIILFVFIILISVIGGIVSSNMKRRK